MASPELPEVPGDLGGEGGTDNGLIPIAEHRLWPRPPCGYRSDVFWSGSARRGGGRESSPGPCRTVASVSLLGITLKTIGVLNSWGEEPISPTPCRDDVGRVSTETLLVVVLVVLLLGGGGFFYSRR